MTRNKQVYWQGQRYKWNGEFHFLCSAEPCCWVEPTGWARFGEAFYAGASECEVQHKGARIPLLTWARAGRP